VQLWEFSDENIQAQADFIAGGCQYNDSILEALLANAYTECSAEVETARPTSQPAGPTAANGETSGIETPTSNTQTKSSSSCNSYTKLPDGKISYGMNDGGCFFCGKAPASSIPLSGAALSEHCQQTCDSDPLCISYEVGKTGALPAYEHSFDGETFNCCLQRTTFPSGVFVDATNIGDAGPNNCQMDSLCWTRYEKITKEQQDEEVVFAVAQNQCDKDYIPPPSNLCSVVLDEKEFSDENIQDQVDFIAGGCQTDDTTFESLLAQAYTECSAEVEQQSAAAFSFSISHTRVFHFVALIVYSVVIVFV